MCSGGTRAPRDVRGASWRLAWSAFLACALLGCDGKPQPVSTSAARASSPVQPASAPARDERPLVVFLGDSLTAAYGLALDEGFPALLSTRLAEQGLPFRAVNAGVSGDTSAGGLERLAWQLRQGPELVVVGLGGNDGLRGQPVASIEANLRAIVERCRAAGAQVLLLGMRLPPNYGPEYLAEFEGLYPRLARELALPFVPFLLQGVGGVAPLNQDDQLHPNAQGQRVLASNIEPVLRAWLEARRGASAD